ncbi:hypothetical protein PVMG_05977 [Plasmodium vivax Mauritania I]|uniref:Variable surface protein n=1 Tax=Plasmodium vivax Mauritania I TaxID=1035515 RepID=A0A0J9THJ8_PLAVI|nr:hypothetical protein PVMG_05977 [Plasmodium vivax Mauritania I]
MTTPNSDPKYIVYKNYGDVKVQFDKCKTFSDNKEEFDKIINDINIEQKDMNLLKEIFMSLHKIIDNGHVFSYMNIIDDYCSYVNYWLNKEVRNKYESVNEKIFDNFHKFVVNFNIERYGKDKNTCYGYIKYLNVGVYNRMEILEYLYELYKNIKPQKGSSGYNLCSTLSLMRHYYEDSVFKHKGDEYFFNKLKDLKSLIEANEWATNRECPAINYIKLPEEKPPQPIEVPEASKQPRTLTQESLSQDRVRSEVVSATQGTQESVSQVLSKAQDRVRLEDVSGTKDTQEAMIPLRTLEVSESSESLVSYDEHETRATVGSQYSVGPSIPELQANSVYTSSLRAPEPARPAPNQETYISQSTDEFPTDKIIDIPEASITVVDPKTNAIPQEGLMEKIQGVEEDAGIKSLLISEENTLSDFLAFQNMTIDILEINNIIYLTKPNSIYYIIS